MNTDKNTIIGFILMGVLFFAFFWYTNKNQEASLVMQKHIADSTARADSLRKLTAASATGTKMGGSIPASYSAIKGVFAGSDTGRESITTIENADIKIYFTNKGGLIRAVKLKKFKAYNHEPVILGSNQDRFNYELYTPDGDSLSSAEMYFKTGSVTQLKDGSQQIDFSLKDTAGREIDHRYVIRKDGYHIDWTLLINGAQSLFRNGQMRLDMICYPQRQEGALKYERQQSSLCYYMGDKFDYTSMHSNVDLDKQVNWFSVVQQFFNISLIPATPFISGHANWNRREDSSNTLFQSSASFLLNLPQGNGELSIPFALYYGPNDIKLLKKEAPEMDHVINLGRGMYSFVRPINKYLLMPVFGFIGRHVSNIAWAILILTLIIRLVISPLTYTSYLSGAKMKILRPELDKLRKKMGDDQQGYAVAQMKLFKEAGVNPMGGCIPALLQIPIFFALYSLFNSNILLRGQAFLWCKDLASYDTIATFPFTIPFGVGNHLSLFTILAVASSFLISIYNMDQTATQANPSMKYMPYMFPFMMFFIFNGMPAALTWYYTVSNVLTLLLQLVMQRFFLDKKKILAKMDDVRKNPKKKQKSAWQQRYEQMMEGQKKMQELKQRSQGPKK